MNPQINAVPGFEILLAITVVTLAHELKADARIGVPDTAAAEALKKATKAHPGWTFATPDDDSEEPLDAAVLFWTLQSTPNPEKEELMIQIAETLAPGAPLVIANLFGDPESTRFKRLSDLRQAWIVSQGIPIKDAQALSDLHLHAPYVVSEERLKTLCRDAGYIDFQRLYQALNVGLWLTRMAR